MHCVLKSVNQYFILKNTPENNAPILDGMGVLQQMQNISNIFGDLALCVLKNIVNMGIKYKSKVVHFVTDTYPSLSIKHSEWKRTAGEQTIIKIGNSKKEKKNKFKKFPENGWNKEALIEFFFSFFKE